MSYVSDKEIESLGNECINGKPVSQIPRNLIPQVQAYLENRKSKSILAGDANTVRSIQKVLRNISKLLYVPKKEVGYVPKKCRKREASSNTQNQSNKLLNILEDLVSGQTTDIVESPVLPDLIPFTKHKVNNMIENGELIEAQKYENATKQLLQLEIERSFIDGSTNRRLFYEEQLQTTLEQIEEKKIQMKHDLKDHDSKIEALKAKEHTDWIIFVEEYDKVTNGELPVLYKKLSPKLLDMREREKFLLNTRRFEEAGYKRLEANELERQELEELKRQFVESREIKKATLKDNYLSRVDCIEKKGKRVRFKIETQYKDEIAALQHTVDNLKNKINNIDVQVSKRSSPVPTPIPSPPISPHPQKTFLTQVQTPNKMKTRHASTPTKITYPPVSPKYRIQNPPNFKTPRAKSRIK